VTRPGSVRKPADATASLAIHPGALGDVLLAIPALRALRESSAKVILAAQPHIASLVVALGEADAACDFESLRLDALLAGDEGACLPQAARIVCWFGARDPCFPRRLAELAPRVTVAPSTAPGRDVWEHLLVTAAEPGATARREPAHVAEALQRDGAAALDAAGVDPSRPIVVVHPGAFADTLTTVSARAGIAVVIHEGPADADVVAQLASLLPSARVLRTPALGALAGVLARCTAYVGNDSGVSHLAAAVGAPAVILFAPSNLAWRPWTEVPRVVTVAMERANDSDVGAVRGALGALLE